MSIGAEKQLLAVFCKKGAISSNGVFMFFPRFMGDDQPADNLTDIQMSNHQTPSRLLLKYKVSPFWRATQRFASFLMY